MSLPSDDFVATWIVQNLDSISQGNSWVHIDSAIHASLDVTMHTRSVEERAEHAEFIAPYVEERLRDLISTAEVDGQTCLVEISGDSYVRATGAGLGDLSRRLTLLSPADFERFCAEILSRLGGDSVPTGQSGDGGIDFVCTDLKMWPAGLPAPTSLRFVVLGQAKRYTNALISTTDLRSFVGAAMLRQHEMVASRALSLRQPVVFAYWTTSDFDQNAKNFARKVGLWIMGGVTLAKYANDLGVNI